MSGDAVDVVARLKEESRSRCARTAACGAADFDLELLEHRTLDGAIQELVYRPTPHVGRR